MDGDTKPTEGFKPFLKKLTKVWIVSTEYENGSSCVNCVCGSEERAKKEKVFLENNAHMAQELLNTKVAAINIQDWVVL